MELVSNLLQFIVTLLGFSLSGIWYLKSRKQTYFLLTCFYGCFALGSLYWTLYLLLFSETPQVFYVSEFGWMASVIFLYILQYALSSAEERGFATRKALIALLVGVPLCVFYCTFGDILSNLLWCGMMIVVSYHAIRGLAYARTQAGAARDMRYFHIGVLCYVAAEYALWTSGCFWPGDSISSPYCWFDLLLTPCMLKLSTATGYIYGYVQDLTTGMWQYIILDFATGETVFTMDVSNKFGYNNMAIGMYAGNSGNALYCPTGYMELLRLQDRFVYLPEMPYREVDLDKAARNILSQEQFELDGGEGTVASWSNSVSIRNVHPNTTVAFRMNNLSGSASDLSLYAYGTDGKLAKVASELWSITDETGEAVTELTDGTLYEVRITVADGGELDLSEVEKEIKFSCVLGK